MQTIVELQECEVTIRNAATCGELRKLNEKPVMKLKQLVTDPMYVFNIETATTKYG